MPSTVELREVSFTYPNGVRALSDINLTIGEREFVFLIGPTGHGKSTLLKLLYQEELPTRGQVLVSGWDVGQLSPSRVAHLRRRIGVVFQDFRLLPQRTAWENIAFALRATGSTYRGALRRVPEVLNEVNLLDRATAFPSELSAGEQQRLALARALSLRPPLILADEPTGNLDPQASAGLTDLLTRVNQEGTTIIVATHDPAIVNATRRRVIALHHGRVVSDLAEGGYPHDLGRN
jgi:cell division transport system ATP-binding protein